jgi:hypothetical protein
MSISVTVTVAWDRHKPTEQINPDHSILSRAFRLLFHLRHYHSRGCVTHNASASTAASYRNELFVSEFRRDKRPRSVPETDTSPCSCCERFSEYSDTEIWALLAADSRRGIMNVDNNSRVAWMAVQRTHTHTQQYGHSGAQGTSCKHDCQFDHRYFGSRLSVSAASLPYARLVLPAAVKWC